MIKLTMNALDPRIIQSRYARIIDTFARFRRIHHFSVYNNFYARIGTSTRSRATFLKIGGKWLVVKQQ